jgi:DNA polymerase I
LDFFNLPFLSDKLLARTIKGYKDIVPKEKTFLELPFEEMTEHTCTDADLALQLHAFLERELKDRQIDQQFEMRTMSLTRTLLKLEKDGIPVDGARLEKLRFRLVDGMLELKKHVSGGIGSEIDLDSQKEISILMAQKLGLREVLGRKSLTQSLIEQFALQRPLLKRWPDIIDRSRLIG